MEDLEIVRHDKAASDNIIAGLWGYERTLTERLLATIAYILLKIANKP